MNATGGTSVTVDRVLGSGPFAEIGVPTVAATSPNGRPVAVGGDLGWPQWHGNDVRGVQHHVVGVYRADDLACVHRSTSRWPVNTLAFHPDLPVLAIGTGSYDGGYAYEGELLLLDLETGTALSLLAHPREVRQLRWSDRNALELVLAPPTDDDGPEEYAPTIECPDWHRAIPEAMRVNGRVLDCVSGC